MRFPRKHGFNASGDTAMVVHLRRSRFNRIAAIWILIAIALFTDGTASAQQSPDWARCNAGETSGASLDLQISGCTTVIQSGNETKWNMAVALYKRGGAYYYKGDYDRAIADYYQATRLGLYIADVFNNRGIAYSEKGDNDRAISDYNEAIRLDPNHSRAFTNRGNAYYEKGDHNRAIVDYNEAIRFDPDNADAFNNRCWVRAVAGQLGAALDDCEESLRLRPNDAEFLDSRGSAYLKLGQIDNAMSDYDAVLKQIPNKPHSLYGRGLAKLKKNDKQGGEADIAAAKAINASIAEEFDRRRITPGGMRPGGFATASAVASVAQAAQAPALAVATRAVTVKELFQKYDLIGTFAADCSMPASGENQYVVHRTNGDYVQRDSMTGPTARSDASLIDSATEPRPNELGLSLVNERGRTNAVVRMESRQWRFMESTRENGEKLISGGRATQGARNDSPWLKKCG